MTFAETGVLFAQAGGGGGGNAADGAAGAGMAIGMMACYAVVLAAAITMHVLFALNVVRTLKLCDPRNRTMEPNQVWLNFIPLFNIVWIFITIVRVAETLEAEFRDRGLRAEGDFGKTNGLVAIIAALVACSPVALIFYIIYWVKMAGYRKQLEENGGSDRRDDEEEDRPSRRGRNDDEEEDRPSRRGDKDRDEEDRPSRRGKKDRDEDDGEDEDERPSRRRKD